MNENKKFDYLVLLNEDNRLPDGFEDTYGIEKKTYEAFFASS